MVRWEFASRIAAPRRASSFLDSGQSKNRKWRGGSAGIGLETARPAHDKGAKLILAARNPEPLECEARDHGALSSTAFDATDFERLEKFFDALPKPIDHVLVTGPYRLKPAGC